MPDPFATKQLEFLYNSTKKWNIAHGSVRSGKTVGSLFAFLHSCYECPDSQLFMVGHSSDTIYRNAVRLIFESDQLAYFRPFCTWESGKRRLKFLDKTIQTLGAKDEGAVGNFQGLSMSRVYCDEMTLYPDSIIDMIDTRLSYSHSKGYATMNPSYPTHKIKKWIDKAEAGDPNYYALHFTLDDNPYVDDQYKQRIRDSLSGLFYKRNYLGLWCLAEGAIFDFFDHNVHVLNRAPRAAEYYVAGIDYGTSNNFACVLMGVATGRFDQMGVCRWVEKEWVWDSKKMGRQKTNSEYANDVEAFLEPYGPRAVYVDPSAASFILELRKRGIHVVAADNDVLPGLTFMTSEMAKGNLFVLKDCKYLINEIEGYVWDSRVAERGEDKPLKKNDHACVVGDTLLQTKLGVIKIKWAFGSNSHILTCNDGQFKYSDSVGMKKTRENAQILKLTLENGKTLKATPDHQVLTRRGYIEIQYLLNTDEILCDVMMNVEYAQYVQSNMR